VAFFGCSFGFLEQGERNYNRLRRAHQLEKIFEKRILVFRSHACSEAFSAVATYWSQGRQARNRVSAWQRSQMIEPTSRLAKLERVEVIAQRGYSAGIPNNHEQIEKLKRESDT
jgi:hypothetical protein